MKLSRWNGIIRVRRRSGTRPAGRRPLTRLNPACEALDNRQLLSTAAPATAGFSLPPATAVTSAANMLQSVAPRAFAQFQTALAKAEQDSHVEPAAASALAQDEAVVDQDVEAAGLTSDASSNDLNDVQDWVDNAFTYGSGGIRDARRNLVALSQISQLPWVQNLQNVPALFQASGSEASPIDQLISQIKLVAKEAKLTPAVQSALNRSYSALDHALGPEPYTNLGPGATHRDPLAVYYDGQVENFVK
jgi:hypothetical protein